ncbi:hypothetical protein BD410DRAFT_802401 [Rickenella mellea]|uniref:Uncharacterized protein n=1 Tax=Rickenella mellea TaxID=50990 RepID=A0A4Y7Q814_9AGAM|nr:hypothetical protein BD410DRAFT_802401 [Rickenella mellea]
MDARPQNPQVSRLFMAWEDGFHGERSGRGFERGGASLAIVSGSGLHIPHPITTCQRVTQARRLANITMTTIHAVTTAFAAVITDVTVIATSNRLHHNQQQLRNADSANRHFAKRDCQRQRRDQDQCQCQCPCQD